MSDVRDRILIVDNVSYDSVILNGYGENNQSTIFFTDNNDNHGDILVGDTLYTNLYDVDPNTDIVNSNNYAVTITRDADTHDVELSYIKCNEEFFTFDIGHENNTITQLCEFSVPNVPNGINATIMDNIVNETGNYLFSCSSVPNGRFTEIIIQNNNPGSDFLNTLDYPFDVHINVFFEYEQNGVTQRYENTLTMQVINTNVAPYAISVIPKESLTLFVGDEYKLQYSTTPTKLPDEFKVVFDKNVLDDFFTISETGLIVAKKETTEATITCAIDYVDATEGRHYDLPPVSLSLNIYPAEYGNIYESIYPDMLLLSDSQHSFAFEAVIYPTEILKMTGANYNVNWSVTPDLPSSITMTKSNKHLKYSCSSVNNQTLFATNKIYKVSCDFEDIYGEQHYIEAYLKDGGHVPVTSSISLKTISLPSSNGTDYDLISDSEDFDGTFTMKLRLMNNGSRHEYPDPEITTNLYSLSNTFSIIDKEISMSNQGNEYYTDIEYTVKLLNTSVNDYVLTFVPTYPNDNSKVNTTLHVKHENVEATSIISMSASPETMYIESSSNISASIQVELFPDDANKFTNLILNQSPSGYFTINRYVDEAGIPGTHKKPKRTYHMTRNISKTTPATVTFSGKILESSTVSTQINVVNQIQNPSSVKFMLDGIEYNKNMNIIEYIKYDLVYELLPAGCQHDDVVYMNKQNIVLYDDDTKIKVKNTSNSLSYKLSNNTQVQGTLTFNNVNELKPIFGSNICFVNTDGNLQLSYNMTTDKLEQLTITFGSSRTDLFTVENSSTNKFIPNKTNLASHINQTISDALYIRVKTKNPEDFDKTFYADVQIKNAQVTSTGITARWINSDGLLTKGKTNKLLIQFTPANVNTFDIEFSWNASENIDNVLTFTQNIEESEIGQPMFDVTMKTDISQVKDIQITCTDIMPSNVQSCVVNASLCPQITNPNLSIDKNILYVLYDSNNETPTPQNINMVTVTSENTKPFKKVEFMKEPSTNTMTSDGTYFNYTQNNSKLTIKSVKNFKNVNDNNVVNNVIGKTITIRARFNNHYVTNAVSFTIKAKVVEIESKLGTQYLKLNETLDISKIINITPSYGDLSDVYIKSATIDNSFGCQFDRTNKKFIKTNNKTNTTIGNSTSTLTLGIKGMTLNPEPQQTVTLNVIPKQLSCDNMSVFVGADTDVNYSYTCIDYNNSIINDSIFSATEFNITSTNSNVKFTAKPNPSTNFPTTLPKLSYTVKVTNNISTDAECKIKLLYIDNDVTKNIEKTFNISTKSITLNNIARYYYYDPSELLIPLSMEISDINVNDYLSTTHGEHYNVKYNSHEFENVSTNNSKFSNPTLMLSSSQLNEIHDELTGDDTFNVDVYYKENKLSSRSNVKLIKNCVDTSYSVYDGETMTNNVLLKMNNLEGNTSKHLLCKFSYIDIDDVEHYFVGNMNAHLVNNSIEDVYGVFITQNNKKQNNVFTYTSILPEKASEVLSSTSEMLSIYYNRDYLPYNQYNEDEDSFTYVTNITFALTPNTNTNVNGSANTPNTSDEINSEFTQTTKFILQLHRFRAQQPQYAQQVDMQNSGDTNPSYNNDVIESGTGGGGSVSGSGGGTVHPDTPDPDPYTDNIHYGELELLLPYLGNRIYKPEGNYDKVLVINYLTENAAPSVYINITELYNHIDELSTTYDWNKVFIGTLHKTNNTWPLSFVYCQDVGNAYRILFDVVNDDIPCYGATSIMLYDISYSDGSDWHVNNWWLLSANKLLSEHMLVLCDEIYKINN